MNWRYTIFFPSQNLSACRPVNTGRPLFTSTLLPDAKVLLGRTPWRDANPTAELFDPFALPLSIATAPLNLHRKRHRALLLNDGTVFVSGGAALSNDQQPNSGTPTCEIYDPAAATWTYTLNEMHVGRTEHESTLLPDGTVLQSGGYLLPTLCEVYDPLTQTFTSVGSLIEPRNRHVAILLT